LQPIQIPRHWKEAKQDPKWCDAKLEELRALEKNKTSDIVVGVLDRQPTKGSTRSR
jgi:phage host-nuclease inhibitor protein Gam